MKKRRGAERPELLALVATSKNFAIVASVIACLFLFLGSPARPSVPAEKAVGSMDLARPELLDSAPADEGEDLGLYYSVYRVLPGDTVGAIAESFGVSQDSVISFNEIQNTRALRPGKLLKIPSMAGILYVAKEGDTAESVAESFDIDPNGIIEANGLMNPGISANRIVFLPDARLPSIKLREINGDLFRWPIRGWVTSRFGWRNDPFSGARSFHNGLDIGSPMGTPIGSAMEGRVIETGYSSTLGNYVYISHHSGWSSFYGHMSSIAVKAGKYVLTGTKIGSVGSTGYSTGPHVHFAVFKSGRSMNPSIVLH